MKECITPIPPVLECRSTSLYGVKKGTHGRVPPLPAPQTPVPISGIVVHCLPDSYEGYLSKACFASPSLQPCGHSSMHYVIDALSSRASCLVPEADVAWAFDSYLSNFPLPNPSEPYPGWPELRAEFPGISADFYTLNIAITGGLSPINEILDNGEDCCIGPYGMIDQAYHNLIKLIAYLADKYDIPVNTQHIASHDDIVERLLGCEECQCVTRCLICDVAGYCEGCKNLGDPSFVLSDTIEFIYGESSAGCKVKIPVALLGAQLDAL